MRLPASDGAAAAIGEGSVVMFVEVLLERRSKTTAHVLVVRGRWARRKREWRRIIRGFWTAVGF